MGQITVGNIITVVNGEINKYESVENAERRKQKQPVSEMQPGVDLLRFSQVTQARINFQQTILSDSEG